MLRLDTGSLPSRVHRQDRRPGMLALGASLGLHGAVLVGFILFWEATPPEPYAVIAVELVQTASVMGSPGKNTGEPSPLSKPMERASTKAAENAPDPVRLADSRDQGKKSDAFEAIHATDGSHVEKTTKPIQFSAPAPTPENTSDAREATPPIPPEPLPLTEDAVATEERRRIPTTPQCKPVIQTSPTDRKSARSRFEEELTEMKDESRRPADQESAREGAQVGADRPAARAHQTAALVLEKKRDAAAAPTSVRTHGLGESSGTRPRYSGGGLSNAAPRYPYLARRRGQEGRVVLRVQVSATGDPSSVRVRQSSGYRQLDDAAVKAVKTWRFVPSNRGGVSVAGSVDVPVSFKLTDR